MDPLVIGLLVGLILVIAGGLFRRRSAAAGPGLGLAIILAAAAIVVVIAMRLLAII